MLYYTHYASNLFNTRQPKGSVRLPGIPDLQWEKPATQKVNLHAINLDVPRQIFVDKHISFEAIKTRWQDAAKQENYAYTQGDMTEALAADLIYSHILAPQLEASGMDGNKIQAIKANFIYWLYQ